MSEWNNYSLGGLAEITSSKRIFYSEYVDSGIPFYRSKEVINLFKKEPVQTELFITQERFNEIESKFGVPKENDILLTSVGSLGIPYLVKASDKFYFKDGNLTWFRNIDKSLLDPKYLYIWLSSSIGKQKLDEVTIGSTQAALTISGLKTIEIELPPVPEQKAIASVLSSLDDKIDLLHRQNKTLEAMAETLFRQWFIEEAKEDWEVKPLSSIISTTSGYVRKPTDIDGEAKLLSMGVVPKFFGMNDSACKPIDGKHIVPHHKVSVHDLIISTRDVTQDAVFLGAPAIIPSYRKDEDLYIGANLFKLELTNPDFGKWSLYCLLRSFPFREYVRDVASGTSVLMLKKSDFLQYEIKYPRPNYLREMEADLAPIFEKLDTNLTHLMTVKKLRDTLLPKLMSGEIRVQYQTEQVA